MESRIEALRRAIDLIGSSAALARAMKVKPQAVTGWLRDGVPTPRVLELAATTGWRVTPHELDPATYPYPSDGVPPEVRVGEAA